jgi:hypothetical protein
VRNAYLRELFLFLANESVIESDFAESENTSTIHSRMISLTDGIEFPRLSFVTTDVKISVPDIAHKTDFPSSLS